MTTLKAVEDRRAKVLAKMDGAKAYEAVDSMEDPIVKLEGFLSAIELVATADDTPDVVAAALIAITAGMQSKLETIGEARSTAWDATWGFVHGPKAVPEEPSRPPDAETLANLENLVAGWKREAAEGGDAA